MSELQGVGTLTHPFHLEKLDRDFALSVVGKSMGKLTRSIALRSNCSVISLLRRTLAVVIMNIEAIIFLNDNAAMINIWNERFDDYFEKSNSSLKHCGFL